MLPFELSFVGDEVELVCDELPPVGTNDRSFVHHDISDPDVDLAVVPRASGLIGRSDVELVRSKVELISVDLGQALRTPNKRVV